MIAIKPHHFIDIVTSCSGGPPSLEPHAYGHAVHSVSEQVLDSLDVELVMELGADDICQPCRHNIGGLCDDTIDTSFRPTAPPLKRDWNLLIDQRWCERLGLQAGDRLTARQFCERLGAITGELDDTYREVPASMNAERLSRLRAGVEYLISR
ncbi:hypothetical protein ACFL6X_08385 [Candidatus Latescibacterota bacterium]